MAYILSEENIKHCTLGFLKSYYKNNSSRGFGTAEAKLDMVTAEGIVADGYLKFSVGEESTGTNWSDLIEDTAKSTQKKKPKPKQKTTQEKKPKTEKKPKQADFLATFEATSQETAEEIQYKVQNTLLLIDALVIGLMIAAGSYGYNYLRDQFTLNELGFFKFWAGFLAVLLASLLGYILIFRFFPRYRYIYALAQFDRYRADEQWVSYGEDVFSNPENKYLIELKKQCVRKGYGLISVNAQLQPFLVITPAREEKGGARKRMKQFFDSTATITKKRLAWLKLPAWMKKRMPAWMQLPSFNKPNIVTPINTDDYLRYTKSYWKQGLLIVFSLGVIGEIYWEETKNPNIAYIGDTAYKKKILEQTKDNKTEPSVTFLDLETGDRKKVQQPRSNKGRPTAAEYVDPVIKTPKSKKQKKSPTYAELAKSNKAVIISIDGNEFISYSCSRLAHLKGEIYLIQVDIANTHKEALALVKEYNNAGFRVNALTLSCFYKNNSEFVLYLDDIYASKADATARANEYHKLKVAKGQHRDQTLIRVIKRLK